MSNQKSANIEKAALATLLKLGSGLLPKLSDKIHDFKVIARNLPILDEASETISTFLDNLVTISTIEGNPVVMVFLRKVEAEKGKDKGEIIFQILTGDTSLAQVEITVEPDSTGAAIGYEVYSDDRDTCEMIGKVVASVESPNTKTLCRKDNFSEKDNQEAQAESSEERSND